MTNYSGDTNSRTRRSVLKGIAGTGVGLATVGAMSSPASAGKGEDCDPDGDPARIDTSDHYDTTWYGSVYLTDGNTETNYDEEGEPLPEDPDELVIDVHGWQNNETCGIGHLEKAIGAYEDNDYEYPVIGLTWDSDYAWWNAKEIAEKNAPKLANFLTDYADDNPDTTIRVQAHSVGALLLAETLVELDEDGNDDVITTALFMGGAIDDQSVATDGKYGDAIANVTEHTENFWYAGDSVLNWAYQTLETSGAIGNEGCEGEAPENYTDHEIEKDIGHSDYYKDEEIVGRFIETY